MKDKSWHYTRALLENYHGNIQVVEKYFSTSIVDRLRSVKLSPDKSDLLPSGFIDIPFGLQNIHFSWVLPLFQDRPLFEKELILTTLPADMALNLRNKLGIKERKIPLNPKMRSWIFNLIYTKLFSHVILPESSLPHSHVTPLLKLTKRTLEQVCDFLGLFDLAEEMRKTIDKPTITRIYSELSSREIIFLEQCLTRRFLWRLPPLGLETWLKNSAGVRHVLQKRGLTRLCVALSGEDEAFIEQILYRFDTGRAKILKHLIKPTAIEPATSLVQKQLSELLNMLFPKAAKAFNPK